MLSFEAGRPIMRIADSPLESGLSLKAEDELKIKMQSSNSVQAELASSSIYLTEGGSVNIIQHIDYVV